MHEKKSISQRVDEFLGGKGFYIVLFACIAIIGLSAWLLLFSRFSPLSIGDGEDYVHAMGDHVTPKDPSGASAPSVPTVPTTPTTPTAPTRPAPTGDPTAPPKGTGSLAIQDPTKATSPTSPPKEDEPKPDETAPGAAKGPEDLTFAWPVSGEISAVYSPDALVFNPTMGDWRTHDGVDIQAPLGTKVLCCANGTVLRVYTDDLMGTTVVIDHGAGVISTCSNLAAVPTVKEGDSVTLASVIGSVGDTALGETSEGPHLHFSLTVNGKSADPAKYLPKK